MKTLKIFTIVLVCTIIIISQTACAAKEKAGFSDTQYDLLNTTCTVTIYDINAKEAKQLIDETFALCLDYEKQLSKTIEGSDIYKVNNSGGLPVKISESTAFLIEQGLYFGDISQGNFDITVGNLSNLWDFSADSPKVPAQDKIEEAVETINYTKLQLSPELEGDDGRYLQMKNSGGELDLGGIAKGYIADRAAQFLMDKGVTKAIINLGGNIVAIGEKSQDVPWNIGVEKPFSDRREIIGSVPVKNKTVVTSGIYERMFVEDGILYHHILDVKTGYPVSTDVEAVTLVGEMGKSMECDALSTICLMLGSEKGLELIESTPGVEAAFIDKNGNIKKTSGMDIVLSE